MGMKIFPYVNLFGRESMAETRVLSIRGDEVLPDDEYVLLEAYCVDPRCDCKTGWITVLARRREVCVVVLHFRLFPEDNQMRIEFTGPVKAHAERVLEMVSEMLREDKHYFALVKSHYKNTKQEAKRRTKKGEAMPSLKPEDLVLHGVDGRAHRDFIRLN